MICQNFCFRDLKRKASAGHCFTIIFLLFLLFFSSTVSAQYDLEKKYLTLVAIAHSDSAKVVALSKLANYYYEQAYDAKGDSVVEKQLMYAEESRNRNLILFTLFQNARFQYVESFSKYEIHKTLAIIQKALNYATLAGLEDYIALGYSRMGTLLREEGKLEDAYHNASTGFITALNTTNDSIKVITALELGKVYLQQGEVLKSFKAYTNAYDYAIIMHDDHLLSLVYHHMSDLFKKLHEDETAKDYIFKSLQLNKAAGNTTGILQDYFAFGKLNDYSVGMTYLQRMEQLADSVENLRYKFIAHKFIFIQKMVNDDPQESLKYLWSHPQLVRSYQNKGPGQLEWAIGEIFLYRGVYDSAVYYMKLVQPYIDERADNGTKMNFYHEFGFAYEGLGNRTEAIKNYKAAMDYAKTVSDLYKLRDLSSSLKSSYEKIGDYKEALAFDKLSEQYMDSVNRLGKDKELALLQIDNENKRRLRETELAEQKLRRKHDLQYIGITMAIGIAFIFLITLGMFTVSASSIRIMAFFSFILLFEFIILLLDNYIHHLTHGEPLKVWGIKIVVISMLIPLHHFLEHRLIHYLVNKKLIRLKSRFSLKKLIFGEKKPVVKAEPQVEINEELIENPELAEIAQNSSH